MENKQNKNGSENIIQKDGRMAYLKKILDTDMKSFLKTLVQKCQTIWNNCNIWIRINGTISKIVAFYRKMKDLIGKTLKVIGRTTELKEEKEDETIFEWSSEEETEQDVDGKDQEKPEKSTKKKNQRKNLKKTKNQQKQSSKKGGQQLAHQKQTAMNEMTADFEKGSASEGNGKETSADAKQKMFLKKIEGIIKEKQLQTRAERKIINLQGNQREHETKVQTYILTHLVEHFVSKSVYKVNTKEFKIIMRKNTTNYEKLKYLNAEVETLEKTEIEKLTESIKIVDYSSQLHGQLVSLMDIEIAIAEQKLIFSVNKTSKPDENGNLYYVCDTKFHKQPPKLHRLINSQTQMLRLWQKSGEIKMRQVDVIGQTVRFEDMDGNRLKATTISVFCVMNDDEFTYGEILLEKENRAELKIDTTIVMVAVQKYKITGKLIVVQYMQMLHNRLRLQIEETEKEGGEDEKEKIKQTQNDSLGDQLH